MEDLDVQILDTPEERLISGGLHWIPALILGGLASELLFDGPGKCWEDFKKGFRSV